MDTNTSATQRHLSPTSGPIGLFDSGFGGLSIFREIHRLMPDYDYIFLGDNGRAPYGNRPFSEVFEFTLQAVERLFEMGCPLVILACNTASAKALRNIQQLRLPFMDDPTRRVLGVIRPTVEQVGEATKNGHIGLVATRGTIESRSYSLELEKLLPEATVCGHACPQWVPLIESGQLDTPAVHRAVAQDLELLLGRDPEIDTLILGCTHYPLIRPVIEEELRRLGRPDIRLLAQGPMVARSLADYLRRHPEMERRLTHGAHTEYFTTGSLQTFERLAALHMGAEAGGTLHARTLQLDE
jgi:glutamate racemase